MKKITATTLASLTIIFLICCSKYHNDDGLKIRDDINETQSELSNGGIMSFANGQAALLLPHLNGQVQHFSFHVVKDAKGNAKGTWESKSPGQGLRTHGVLNCLVFI